MKNTQQKPTYLITTTYTHIITYKKDMCEDTKLPVINDVAGRQK